MIKFFEIRKQAHLLTAMPFIRMRYISILLNIVVISASGIQAQPIYKIQFPFTISPVAGAEFHILLHHELSSLDNKYIPSRVFHNDDFFSKTGNLLYRLLRIGSYDFYMSYIPVVNQHEYFGHLARAKQFNAGFTRYKIYLFPPTGGRAFYGNHKFKLTNSEQISEYIGGVESNAIMAKQIRLNSLLKGKMSFQDAMLYIGARTDFIGYVLLEDNGSHDDINRYLHILNKNNEQGKFISKRNLILPSILSLLLDPYTLQSVYGLIDDFIFHGWTSFNVHSSIIKNRTGFLPLYSFEPSVNGLQNSINGYILTKPHIFKIAVNWGAMNNHDCFGGEISMYGYSKSRKTLSFDIDLRCWHDSPVLYHNKQGAIRTSKSNGILMQSQLYLKTIQEFVSGKDLFVTFGATVKSLGYTRGYPLAEGLFFNAGIGYAV